MNLIKRYVMRALVSGALISQLAYAASDTSVFSIVDNLKKVSVSKLCLKENARCSISGGESGYTECEFIDPGVCEEPKVPKCGYEAICMKIGGCDDRYQDPRCEFDIKDGV